MSSRFRPFDSLSDPDIHLRKLPHWEAEGATYFVTFRLADSIPAGARRELENTERAWLRAHGLRDHAEITRLHPHAQQQYRSMLSRAEHRQLDSGHGACHLREASLRSPLIEAMHFKDGQTYCLDRYVIMPNHVHALILPVEGERLSSIVGNWKKFSAKSINRSLRRVGPLWQDEAFDHIVRAADRLQAFRRYIDDNPVKPNLPQEAYHLGTGSGIVN
jgi:REP element-mobilizing transposase RayT